MTSSDFASIVRRRVVAGLAAALVGCGSSVSGPVRPGDCTDLALGVTPNSLATGGAALVVSAPSATGLSWSVSSPTVARVAVSPSGSTLRPLDTGTTYVRVTDDRGRSCSVDVSVRAGNVISRTKSPEAPFGPQFPMFSARRSGQIEVLQPGPAIPWIDPNLPGPTRVATIDVATGQVGNPRIPADSIPLALLYELANQGIIDERFLDQDFAEFQAIAGGYLAVFAPTSFDNPSRGVMGPLGAVALFLDEALGSTEVVTLAPPERATTECSVFAGAAIFEGLLYLAVSQYEVVAAGECAALERIELYAGPPRAGPLEAVLAIPSDQLSGFAAREESRPYTDTISGSDTGASAQLRTPQLEPATLANGRRLLALQDRASARAVLIDPSARRVWGRIDLSDAVLPADVDLRNFVWGPEGEFWLITTVPSEGLEDPEDLPPLPGDTSPRPSPPADYDIALLTPIPDHGDSAPSSVTGGFDVTLATVDDLLRNNLRLRLPLGLAERGGTLALEGTNEIPEYSSRNESVASVDASGNITLGHAGFAEVVVTAARGESFIVPLQVGELLPQGRSRPQLDVDGGSVIAVSPVGDGEVVALVDPAADADPCERGDPEGPVIRHVVEGAGRDEVPVPPLEAASTPGPGGPGVEEWFTGKDVALDAVSGTYWVAGERTSCFLDEDRAPAHWHRPTLLRVDLAGRLLEERLLEPMFGVEPSKWREWSVQVDPRPDGRVLVGVHGQIVVLDDSGLAAALYENPSFDWRSWTLDEIRTLAGGEVLIVFSSEVVNRRGVAASAASPERDVQIVRLDGAGGDEAFPLARIGELVTGLARDGDNLHLLLADRSGLQAPDLVLTGLASFED